MWWKIWSALRHREDRKPVRRTRNAPTAAFRDLSRVDHAETGIANGSNPVPTLVNREVVCGSLLWRLGSPIFHKPDVSSRVWLNRRGGSWARVHLCAYYVLSRRVPCVILMFTSPLDVAQRYAHLLSPMLIIQRDFL